MRRDALWFVGALALVTLLSGWGHWSSAPAAAPSGTPRPAATPRSSPTPTPADRAPALGLLRVDGIATRDPPAEVRRLLGEPTGSVGETAERALWTFGSGTEVIFVHSEVVRVTGRTLSVDGSRALAAGEPAGVVLERLGPPTGRDVGEGPPAWEFYTSRTNEGQVYYEGGAVSRIAIFEQGYWDVSGMVFVDR